MAINYIPQQDSDQTTWDFCTYTTLAPIWKCCHELLSPSVYHSEHEMNENIQSLFKKGKGMYAVITTTDLQEDDPFSE
jgi:hypothetical protein